jgi:hypothetical protein
VLGNRVLKIIFTPKRDEVTGEWRKLHNEELHNLFSSPFKIHSPFGSESFVIPPAVQECKG